MKIILLIAAAVLSTACSQAKTSGDSPSKKVDKEYTVGSPLAYPTEGIGAQFDMCYLETCNHTDTDWDIISNAVELSNLQAIRMRFYPEMYERANDNDDPFVFDKESAGVDFESAEMKHLYQVLDLMEKNNVNVDLSWYGCRSTFASEDRKIKGSWLGGKYGEGGIDNWMVPPSAKMVANPVEEYAESVVACLDHLINVKKYTCIYEYSIFPEPEGVIGDMKMYGEIAASIKTRLQKAGLADKVKFSGPADYNNDPLILNDKYLSKGYPYDKVTSSVYKFHGTTGTDGSTKVTASTNQEMLEFAQSMVKVCQDKGMSWGVAESGTVNFKTAVSNYDSETYDRALTMFRFFVNLTNAGCTNIKYFVFSDARYDSAMNTLGLFRHLSKYYNDSTKDYQAKPVWYAWGLLMKYTDIGSVIYPVTDSYGNGADPDICITALKLPDGSWTYAAANSGSITKTIAINNVGGPDEMKLYEKAAETRKKLEMVDPSETIKAENGKIIVTIPSMSYCVLSNK